LRRVLTPFLLLLGPFLLWAGKEYPAQPGEQVVPNQLLVKLKSGVLPASVIPGFLPNAQTYSLNLPNIYLVTVPASIPPNVSSQLAAHSLVDFVEPNRIRNLNLGAPNDLYYVNSTTAGEWGLFQVQALQAWGFLGTPYLTSSTANTNRISVAVLDTGADCTHPDFINSGGHSTNSALGGQLYWNASHPQSQDPPGMYVTTTIPSPACLWQDDHGHGTHVSGLVAAATNNGVGMASLGYPLQVMEFKVLDSTGSGSDVTIASAIKAAADAGARVISMSLGGAGYSQTIQNAINYAWQKNAVVVAAAGNSTSSSLFYPGDANHTMAISAVDNTGAIASFSNFGNAIAVAAPGVSVLSTIPTYSVTLGCCNYGLLSGTSMATPFVSALAGLVAMTTPNASAASIVQRIQQTAATNGPGGAWNQSFGYGIINAYNAVSGAARSTSTGGVVGQVTDSSGNSITGATVTVGTQSFTTDYSGLFWFRSVAAGDYTITVAASGYTTQSLNAAVAPGADTPFSVMMGVSYGDINGTVTDLGSPVSGAIVQALSSGLVIGTAVTDSNGQYSLWVPPGSGYSVQASQIGRSTTTLSSYSVAAGGSVTVNLALPGFYGAIAGTVQDTNGNAISGAQVSASSSTISGGATTTASGAYSITGLPAGTYSVTATKTNYSTGTDSNVPVSTDTVTTVNFQLTPPVAAAPTFNYASGTFSSAISIAISTTSPGASIRYTLDGSTPSETIGILYTAPFVLNTATTVKAIAYGAGYLDSPVSTATYMFSFSSGWYNGSGVWSSRKAITLNHSMVSGSSSLSSFPVLVSLTDSNLQTTALPSGNDILFTAADGLSKLNHEIESYNSSTGQLIAWVNLPALSPTADTVIFLYFGNPSAPAQQNPTGVWDANYKAVWHLPNGTSLSPADSTANAANGSINGSVPATSGKIDGAASFSGNSNNFISVPNGSSGPFSNLGNSFTMEAWFSAPTSNRQTIFSFGDQVGTPELEVAGGYIGAIVTGTYEAYNNALPININTGALHHLVYTKNGPGATHALYLDGLPLNLTVNNSNTYTSPTNPLWFGKRNTTTQPWTGILDELRISTTVRPAAWIATEYNNQSAPAAFYTVGALESHP
jgi:hypothetical protein